VVVLRPRDREAKGGVHIRIRAALAGSHGDVTCQLGKELPTFGVRGRLLVLDRRPLGVSGHATLPPEPFIYLCRTDVPIVPAEVGARNPRRRPQSTASRALSIRRVLPNRTARSSSAGRVTSPWTSASVSA